MGSKKAKSDVEEKLIEQVRIRPYLFNIGDMDYKNKTKKDNAWFGIGAIVGLSGKWWHHPWFYLIPMY